MEQTTKENRMGTKPIASLLATMAIPMMLSMLVQALYNVVDSVFVARISESQLELTAVSVAFPIQNLMIAFGTGIGVGFTALISRSLGARDPKTAGKAAAHGMMIEGLSYLLFLAVGLFFVRPFFESQTSNPLIVEYGCQYLSVCCVFSFGLFSQFIFEKALQSTGKTVYSMISQGVGAIVNIILDPIMIFGLFGMPEMGVTGAAAATVIGQMCGALVGAVLHFRRNRELRVELSSFRPEGAIFGRILLVGLPSTIMVAIGSLMNYCMNRILFTVDRVGETAATVFGVYFKLQSFAVMPVFGLNNGMVPIVAYNYGARNSERITKTVKLSVLWAVIIMAVAIGVFQLVRCRRGYDGNRCYSSQNYQSQLCFCRVLHSNLISLSGSWQRTVQYGCIVYTSDRRTDTRGVSICKDGQSGHDLVLVPYRRMCVGCGLHSSVYYHIQKKDKAPWTI